MVLHIGGLHISPLDAISLLLQLFCSSSRNCLLAISLRTEYRVACISYFRVAHSSLFLLCRREITMSSSDAHQDAENIHLDVEVEEYEEESEIGRAHV